MEFYHIHHVAKVKCCCDDFIQNTNWTFLLKAFPCFIFDWRNHCTNKSEGQWQLIQVGPSNFQSFLNIFVQSLKVFLVLRAIAKIAICIRILKLEFSGLFNPELHWVHFLKFALDYLLNYLYVLYSRQILYQQQDEKQSCNYLTTFTIATSIVAWNFMAEKGNIFANAIFFSFLPKLLEFQQKTSIRSTTQNYMFYFREGWITWIFQEILTFHTRPWIATINARS